MEWQRGSETAGHMAPKISLHKLTGISDGSLPLFLSQRLFRSTSLICLDHWSVSVEQTPYTQSAMCYGRVGILCWMSGVELKPDIKHTTKQWSHENRMKLLWGSNREPSQTHIHSFIRKKKKHVLKAWLLKPLPCHSFTKNGADRTWKNLEGADWVTDRQKLPQHPAPFSPSLHPLFFKATDGWFLLLCHSVLPSSYLLEHGCPRPLQPFKPLPSANILKSTLYPRVNTQPGVCSFLQVCSSVEKMWKLVDRVLCVTKRQNNIAKTKVKSQNIKLNANSKY